MAILGNTKITNLTLLDGVIGDLNPVNTDVYNLGTSSLRWNNLYAKAIYGTTQAQTDNSTAMATTAYVRAAIAALDSTLPSGSAASKTLTALTITDGKMTAATFSDIAITESQVSWTNATLFPIGDDVYIGDVNQAGSLGIKSKQAGNTSLAFIKQATANNTAITAPSGTTIGKLTWDGGKFILSGTAPTLGTSNLGSARQLFYLNAGVPTNGNYVVSHFGNASKSNMNDVGRLHASMGMTSLADPSNTTDNPGNGTSWHHYIDISYTDDPNGSNAWVTQFANKAGTTDLWMRSRSGGTITNGTAWTAPWTRILTETNISQALNANNSGLNLLPQSQDLQGWAGTENRTDTPFAWCYSHSAAKGSNSYADISYNNIVTAEPDTWYTLSYWAKASTATAINNYFYNGSVVSQGYNSSGATTTATDGSIAQQLTTTWQRYWVTWKTRSDVTGTKHIILARIQTDATVYVALPKFEKGRVATGWSPNPGDAYHIYGRTGNSNLIYNGGGGTAADYSFILHGNSTTGSSGIAFVSGKGNTAINYPSDRAFIQFHPYGVTTYTAEGTAPTLATSGEAATLVIGVGNDATDTIHLQTPGRTGLYHQVGASYYTIPDTNNTTGTVGSSSLPVYVNAGAITAVTAKDTCNAFINALDTGSSALTANDYVITQYVGGGTTTTTYHRRPANAVVNKTLIDAALGASTTANFYRGDKTWSNTIKQTANAALGVDSSTLKIGTARKDLNFDIGNGSGTGVNDGHAGGITWGNGTSAYAGIYYQSSGAYGTRLIFATTGSYANGSYARMIVQSNGYVGIGTLSPDTLLTVSGNAKATKFIGALEGNADTATAFKSAQSIALTGDVTGSASSAAGWSIATTLANSGATAGSYGDSSAQTPGYGGTFKVPYVTVDAKGRVTSISEHTVTIPASDNTNTTYTFSGGTNGFTVTPSGGSAQTVTVTPSIANNITGSGTANYVAMFNGTNTITSSTALSTFVRTYARTDIGDAPNFDNPGVNGIFELRGSLETGSATGTRPFDGYAPFINFTAPNTLFQLAGINNAGFYIRGIQQASPTLDGVAWQRIITDANYQSIIDKYVLKAGDTMSGALTVNADVTVGGTGHSLKIAPWGGTYGTTGTGMIWYCGTNATQSGYVANTIYIGDTGNTNLYAAKIYNAIWNDYAECRKTKQDVQYGQCVIDNNDGSLSIAEERLLPGAQVVSDTWGHIMGETEEAKTPVAVAGRVLVYPYRDRSEYHAGQAVCTAPNGTVDIMSREEIMMYPDCIVGIVSEIPDYDTWGTGNVKVNGRIWIKVR